ncbi:MerR family transcriptional regulator [Clostridium manihotivorum]|uniref:MerR family transcriptional regulator n=1 Tax=Clostridium manihotivorum TaxID=2320868 RepID=A0A3R5U5I6_9CLOT|nr:MerR family transcriptional regulator [Clostridium manihotivorum]QAA32232.1 MerR family transcriptional regulator [Clostridium manihotivorum]
MEDEYTIGDLVKELKINKETIRYYEKVGLLSEPKKNTNGYRIYSKEDIEMIRFIRVIKGFGFSLKEISILIHGEILCGSIEDIITMVEGKINELNIKINELEEKKSLLEKVNKTLSSEDMEACNDLQIYIKK